MIFISVAVISLILGNVVSVSAAMPVAGKSCPKLGAKQVYKGKTFTCIKSGKKLMWNKGVVVVAAPQPSVKPSPTPSPTPSASASPTSSASPTPTPSPTPTVEPITADNFAFRDWCDPDPFVPSMWKKFQDFEIAQNSCPPPYRYLVKELPNTVPSTAITNSQSLSPISECRNDSTRSWTQEGMLGPKAKKQTVIQVVPFYMNDGVPTTTPKEDWKDALDFAVDAISKMSNGSVNLKINIPDSYIYVNGDLKSYGLSNKVGHGDPAFASKRWELIEKVLPIADPYIDFSDVDMAWFLAPSNVKRTVLSNQIAHSRVIKTAEKSLSIHTSTYISSPISDFTSDGFPIREPFGFVHELMHIFDALDDHYGDGKENLGTGNWGNMSGAMLDFLAWDKWSLGWITDSQVRCAPRFTTSLHWIKPSTIKGSSEKLLMIPISKTKSIAVESIRNSGFNLKLPTNMLGSLVYTIDTAILDDRNRHGEGLNVLCPSNRNCLIPGINSQRFKLAGAALKTGDFVEVSGYKISVVESGDFGDVIKVERTTPAPAPTGFSNLYENRAGISNAAWSKISESVKNNKDKSGEIEILTGPNTKPYFDNYALVKELVSRAFPKQLEPTRTLVIRYNYKDLQWAEEVTRSRLTPAEYDHLNRIEGGKLVSSNCDVTTSNCPGAKQQTTTSGLSIILQGVENSYDRFDETGRLRFSKGMLEAHEYFHSLQRIPITGKTDLWPHAWFREGSAEWIQNVVMNYNNFEAYLNFFNYDCKPSCLELSEGDIREFLNSAKENQLPQKFDPWLNYNLGSRFIEVFVALKGQDILIDMYAEMGKKLSFDQAFKNIFGLEWNEAIPILAKTVYANLRGN